MSTSEIRSAAAVAYIGLTLIKNAPELNLKGVRGGNVSSAGGTPI